MRHSSKFKRRALMALGLGILCALPFGLTWLDEAIGSTGDLMPSAAAGELKPFPDVESPSKELKAWPAAEAELKAWPAADAELKQFPASESKAPSKPPAAKPATTTH